METLFQFAHAEIIRADLPAWWNALVLLWALVLGHALGDFPLQGDFLAVGKDRHADLSAITGGKEWPRGMWFFCLTIHCCVHAAMVWLITGSVIVSMIEFLLHWTIDFVKNEGMTGFYTDQILHVVCKAVYVGLFLAGIQWP